MAKPSKTTFVCQNCGAASPRWAGKCPACGEWNTLTEETDAIAPPGTGLSAPQQRPRHRARRPEGQHAGGAALLDRHRRTRPRHRRRHRAGLGAADRRRARHRQIDAAAAARGDARPRRPARRLLLRRGGGGAGAPARRAPRPVGRAGRARLRDQPRATSWRRSKPDRRPISSSSIPSRRCGPKRIEAAPGTVSQVRAAAQALIRYAKSARQRAAARRPRHQGRADRRPQGDRAHGRHRACISKATAATPSASCARSRTASAPPTRSACSRWRARACARSPIRPSCSSATAQASTPGRRGVCRHRRHAADAGRNPGAGGALGARHAAARRRRLGHEPPVDAARRARSALPASSFAGHDVYLNVAGGLRITEPAADLAAAAALLSSLSGVAIPRHRVHFGEVSLSGAVSGAPLMSTAPERGAEAGVSPGGCFPPRASWTPPG